MTDMNWGTTAIASTLTFVAGGGGVFLLNLLRQRKEQGRADKKQDAELRFSEMDKAFTIYKEFVTSLKKDIEQTQKSAIELEHQYVDTREQKAILQGKLDNAEQKITFLEKELAELRKSS